MIMGVNIFLPIIFWSCIQGFIISIFFRDSNMYIWFFNVFLFGGVCLLIAGGVAQTFICHNIDLFWSGKCQKNTTGVSFVTVLLTVFIQKQVAGGVINPEVDFALVVKAPHGGRFNKDVV